MTGTPVRESSTTDFDFLQYSFASSQKEATTITSASASGKGSFGIGRAKANASTQKFFSTNSFSCYIFAHLKIVHPRVYFANYTIEQGLEEYIRNATSPTDIARKFGDEYITHINIVSELLVKMEIQSNSQSQKNKIIASASGSWLSNSGKGSFSNISSRFTDRKAIKFEVLGNITTLPSALTPQNIDSLMLSFPQRGITKHSIVEYTTEPVHEIPQLVSYDFANVVDLGQRKRFVADIDSIYEDLEDWENDINYVISPSNKSEFRADDIRRAEADLRKIKPLKLELQELAERAEFQWLSKGENGPYFDLSLLNEFPTEYPVYPRIEPRAPATPTPTKKPARERNDQRNDNVGGGRH